MHRFKSKVRELGYLTQYKVFFSSSWGLSSAGLYPESSRRFEPLKRVVVISGYGSCCTSTTRRIVKDITKAEGSSVPFAELFSRYIISIPSKKLNINDTKHCMLPCFTRPLSSNYSSQSSQQAKEESRKDISTIEDPFDDAPTYNIPEKPVTFVEGASYSVIILAGLGVAALAAYAVFKELIFEPKEYKIFGKALDRVQNDSQVKVRIGSPVTGYGQESRNRAARQRISNRVWKDEDGVEHVEVNFYIRGPHGAGKVFAEMFKDNSDKQWRFTYLIVEIMSPTHTQLMLESYVPA
ncbi:hypothetical protein KFK09_008126 [Dendrobium nobile]|uniref:Mitochondrial import inner membrane translocase subunit Tim21 n=1 Tax=Dendrobium nobile TaxID=94219 RepID=A0A8T3BTM7_DENNO|nr:hypothetical protein KFK09_008126 [Dendrobium nobile]